MFVSCFKNLFLVFIFFLWNDLFHSSHWSPLAAAQVTPTERYPEEGTLTLATSNRNSDICMLFWKHDGVRITFEIHCRTRGYVGFGISPEGGMDGADIVIGWVKDGNTFFSDRHGIGLREPPLDDQQDWELLLGMERSGYTILKFARDIVATDDQDVTINEGEVKLIFAYKRTDPRFPGGLSYHSFRGTKTAVLLYPLAQPVPDSLTLETQGGGQTVRPTEVYPFSVVMDRAGKLHLFWKYDESTITFEIHAQTLGYIGFGISPDGQMTGSDMVIGWVLSGNAYFHDRFALERGEPIIDRQQDWRFLLLSETASSTVMKFSRDLVTTDRLTDLPITNGPMHLIWAYHSTDPRSVSPLPYHEFRGSLRVQLLQDPVDIEKTIEDKVEVTENYPYNASLHSDGLYKLYWKYDIDSITFEVHAKTTGYVGFGISPNGGMAGADIALGWVQNGEVTFHDRQGRSRGEPDIDGSQDWELLAYSETDDTTMLKFSRKLVTQDANDVNINSGEVNVIWALHDRDPAQSTGLAYHTIRGEAKLQLIPPSKPKPEKQINANPLVEDDETSLSNKPLNEISNVGIVNPDSANSLIVTEDYPNSIDLDDDNYKLFWKYTNDTIIFEAHVATLGYIGLGISPDGGMADSDIVIGWVKNGKAYFHDRHAEGQRSPDIDREQNWVLLAARETSSHTMIKFTRFLNTKDHQDIPITNDRLYLIWAYQDVDPVSETALAYHTRRGSKSLRLILDSDPVEETFINKPPGPPHQSGSPDDHFPHATQLMSDDDYNVYWRYDDTTITFEIHVRTLGYVGFGISKSGGMVNSDIVTGWIKDQQAFFQDRYADSRTEPSIDSHRDWTLLQARETDTHTILRFKRNLRTCDDKDVDITDATTHLIWAFHESDPDSTIGLPFHSSMGSKSVTLLQPKIKVSRELPPGAFHLDITVPDRPVKVTDTVYWCETKRLTEISRKHHIVRFEPIVQEGHEDLVHHIILYACSSTVSDGGFLGEGYPCFRADADQLGVPIALPSKPLDCNTWIASWAKGGETFDFPEHVGFPLGGAGRSTFVKLEVHYEKTGIRQNYIDSSGLRLWLTPDLREEEAGIFSVLVRPQQTFIIPPYFNTFTERGYCDTQCLTEAMIVEDRKQLNVFAHMLNMHSLGTGIRLRHFRNAQELQIVASDDNYDTENQGWNLNPERTIFPGDHLYVECDYNSLNKNRTTRGGPSTKNEVCLVSVMYYPRIPLVGCGSLTTDKRQLSMIDDSIRTLNTPFGDYIIWSPKRFRHQTLAEIADAIDWRDVETRRRYQAAVKQGETEVVCFHDQPHQTSYKKILQPLTNYQKEGESCINTPPAS